MGVCWKAMVGVGVLATAGILASLAPMYIHARSTTTTASSCVSNLRELDACKVVWMTENDKSTNDTPSWEELQKYFPPLWRSRKPICPEGGVYAVGRVGDAPTCSIGGANHCINSKRKIGEGRASGSTNFVFQ